MAQGVRFSKKAPLDKRIESFCMTSAELLTGIHERYDNTNGQRPKQKRRGRKKKANGNGNGDENGYE